MAIAEAEHDNADLDQKYQTGPAHHQKQNICIMAISPQIRPRCKRPAHN